MLKPRRRKRLLHFVSAKPYNSTSSILRNKSLCSDRIHCSFKVLLLIPNNKAQNYYRKERKRQPPMHTLKVISQYQTLTRSPLRRETETHEENNRINFRGWCRFVCILTFNTEIHTESRLFQLHCNPSFEACFDASDAHLSQVTRTYCLLLYPV